MPYTGEAFRIYYTAVGYVTGLPNVQMYVYKPNGVRLGPYILSELNAGIGVGIYFDDFLDSDIEGNYLFIIDCPSLPHKDVRSYAFEKRIWSEANRNTVLADLGFIMDIEGGKWELVSPNFLVMYRADNVTEVARWRCFNDAGLPSIENIVKCERI